MKRKIKKHVCWECGREFESAACNAKYCSQECRRMRDKREGPGLDIFEQIRSYKPDKLDKKVKALHSSGKTYAQAQQEETKALFAHVDLGGAVDDR